MKIRWHLDAARKKPVETDILRMELVLASGEVLTIAECERSVQAFRITLSDGALLVEPRTANEVVLAPAPALYRVSPLLQPLPAAPFNKYTALRAKKRSKR